jgi:glycosyltransferase involved in cell wall biosynthesis
VGRKLKVGVNMKKIKLGFVSFLAYPLFNPDINAVFGGAEVDLYNLAKKFSQDGKYEITFYVGDFGQPDEELRDGIRVRKFKYMNLELYKSKFHKVLRQINILKEVLAMQCDVCIIEAYNEMLGWVSALPGRLKGTRLIFRLAHDLDTDLKDARSKGILYYWLYKHGIYNADFIVSQTEVQKKMLGENLGLDSTVIKNGFFINENISFENKKYILWVARAQGWKRPQLLTELAKRLPDEKFVMVMPGSGKLQSSIKEQAAKLGNVKFIEYVPFTGIQRYYDEARLFVNTSEYEGFPNAFVQACLAKTPILSFNVNPDGFIEANNLGFFCRDDMDKAVDFIKGLDMEKLEMLGGNAGTYVRKNHDIATLYEEYKDMVDKLAEGKKVG